MEISPEANSDWINASSDEACRLHDAAVDAYGGARIEDAEGLFRRALRMLERVEGEDHPDVARVHNNLAAIYEDRCEYEAAEIRIDGRSSRKNRLGAIRLILLNRPKAHLGTMVGFCGGSSILKNEKRYCPN